MTLAGALLLFSLSSVLFAEASEGLRKTLEVGLSAVLVCLLFARIGEDMARVESAMTDMCRLSGALAPAYASLFLAEGGVGTAAASSAGFAGFTLLLENLAVGLFLPLLRVLLGFTLVSVAGNGAKTDGIFRSLRHTYVTALVFLSLLLTASLGFQTSLAASADGLSVRSVKFALGQLIPVIGGSLAESWRVLTSSLGVLRNTLGAFTVVSLFLLILPTLLTALLHRLGLSLAAALSDLLGCERGKRSSLTCAASMTLLSLHSRLRSFFSSSR
jgi:stage III sporulation protein AE